MNYQDYLDVLDILPPDVKAYIIKAVESQNNIRTVTINSNYFNILEKNSALLDAILYLELVTDEGWTKVNKHYESEQNYNGGNL